MKTLISFLMLIILIFSVSLTSMAQSDCPGNLEQRLNLGELGQVTPGSANNVRQLASTSSESLGKIPAGEVFEVIDGPLCAEGYTWWWVNYLDIRGWTVESTEDEYWLQPYTQPEPLSVAELSEDETTYSVNNAGVQFGFSAELAEGVDFEPIPAEYYAMGGGWSSHRRFTFTEFADKDEQLPSPAPIINIYSFEALAGQVVKGQEEQAVLLDLLEEKPLSIDDEIPIMVGVGAAQILRAQIQYIDFEGGRGLRFLTFYAQDLLIADNQAIRYMFVGLTDDNTYFILGDFPVDASILPDKVNYMTYDMKNHEANYPTYLIETTTALTELPTEEFTPDLALLDALFASLVVESE